MNEPKPTHSADVLKQMRDEIAVQAHLFSMDMKEEWKSLEKQWSQLQIDLRPVQESVAHAKQVRHESLAQIRQSLASSYQQFRDRLKSA